jgi:hypothetical protein
MYKSGTSVCLGCLPVVRRSFVLQALQFYWMVICRKFPDGASISHYSPNDFFVEGHFKVSAKLSLLNKEYTRWAVDLLNTS